jgi:subtilisin family serine protease
MNASRVAVVLAIVALVAMMVSTAAAVAMRHQPGSSPSIDLGAPLGAPEFLETAPAAVPPAAAAALGPASKLGNVTLCLLDTGVRFTHHDLAPYFAGGRDFVAKGPLLGDDNGHGTQVAGRAVDAYLAAVGGRADAPLKILSGKVAGADGRFLWADLELGLRWCIAQGADVISMSVGDKGENAAVASALADASAAGIVLVAAAGNEGADGVYFPARDPHVIAVGCVDADQNLCSFSNRGPQVEVVALGNGVRAPSSASDSAYARRSGTSMAAPVVAGVLAAFLSAHPDASALDARQHLDASAHDLGPSGRDPAFGFGAIQSS